MLRVTIPSGEYWDEQLQEFVLIEGKTILLEHSLVSLARWEARWKKPFLGKKPKTREEMIDYIRCMTLTSGVEPSIYENIDADTLIRIHQYMDDSMTATTFSELHQKRGSRETVTAEVIYYWMIALQIPFECQTWHLNRLLTLIRVCNIKSTPPKKRSKRELMNRNRSLNAERKQKLGTSG